MNGLRKFFSSVRCVHAPGLQMNCRSLPASLTSPCEMRDAKRRRALGLVVGKSFERRLRSPEKESQDEILSLLLLLLTVGPTTLP